MRWRVGRRLLPLCVFAGAILISAVSLAQLAVPPSYSAGAAGGACSSASINYAWPDASGHVLQCVSNVWTAVTQAGTPASPTGSVQFNNSGALGGSANLFWDSTNNRLGIGTSVPANTLDVNGAVAVGSYAGTNTAPSNGMIVNGMVGIGSSSPTASLDVGGGITVANGMGTTLTTLNGALTAGATTITVLATTNYPSAGTISFNGSTEVVTYTGKTGTTFTGCTRGAFGTTAATHSSGTTVYGMVLQVGPGPNGSSYSTALTVFNNDAMIVGTPAVPYGGANSLGVGTNINASGSTSLAVGYSATSAGAASVAIGSSVTTSANNSQAFGYNTTAAAISEMVMGQYNKATGSESNTFSSSSSTNPLFVVGIGTSGQSANALMIFDDGQMLVNGGTTVAIPAGVASLTVMGTTTDSTAAALNATNSSGTSLLYVRNDGYVGIGTTAPAYLLHVGSASASGIVLEMQNSSGTCTLAPGTSSVTTTCSSDIRLKTDISDTSEALPELATMRVRDFTVRATGERMTGVIAQELLTTHPEMVRLNSDGFYAVDSPNPWKLIKAVQELDSTNDNLEARISELKGENDNDAAEIETLRARLDALEAGQ